MNRLPPILRADYRRNVIWPRIWIVVSLLFLAAIIVRALP